MRKLSLLLVLLNLSWLIHSAGAQDPTNITYTKSREFSIPFPPPTERLRSLQLFMSTDQGRTWLPHLSPISPEQGRFKVSLDRDGPYWFTVQSTDMNNQPIPKTLDGVQPSMKVVLDTQSPVVNLKPLPARSGEVGVSWDIQDPNPDLALPDAVRLEYRQAGVNTEWIPVPIHLADRQRYWNPQTVAAIEVRLSARDLAGNLGSASITINTNGGNPSPSPFVQPNPPPPFTPPSPNVASDAERQYVRSKKITLNYELQDVGPSGVSHVELWYTLDGRTWSPYELKFGSDPGQKSVTFEVAREGVYGITLLARSGVGLSEKPPQTGDRPKVWIEVDTTKPIVQLTKVVVGQGIDKGKVFINWSASDKNLQREPIVLSFAEELTGPWTPITADRLPNTGQFVWMLPEKIPYQFYVKVAAVDKAENVGEVTTTEKIRVDLSIPKANIKLIEPAGK